MTALDIIKHNSQKAQDGWGVLYYHVMPKLIKDNNLKTGIEIGVAFGGHAESMLSAGLEKLEAIDPWFPESDYEGLVTREDYDEWYLFVLNRIGGKANVIRSSSDNAHANLKDKSYDFVFIDGLHTYDQVKKDIANYVSKIKQGGFLCGHDYAHECFPGVKVAVDEFVSSVNGKLVLYDGYVWSIQL